MNCQGIFLILKKNREMAEPLGLALGLVIKNRYPELLATNIVVPVPMHDEKLDISTFNQAQQLALKIGKEIARPIIDCITQTKNFSQHNANRVERFNNVRDAFHIPSRIAQKLKGDHILLVDDIMTSGATLDACAKLLLENGARLVDGIVLGRTG